MSFITLATPFKTVFLIYSLISVLFIDLKAATERLTLLNDIKPISFDSVASKVFSLLSIVSTLVFKSVKLFFKAKELVSTLSHLLLHSHLNLN